MTTWTSMRPNSYFCDGLQTKKGNDKRKTLNMAWEYDGKRSTTPTPARGGPRNSGVRTCSPRPTVNNQGKCSVMPTPC